MAEGSDITYVSRRRIDGKLYEVRGVVGDQSFTEIDEEALRRKEKEAEEERISNEESLRCIRDKKKTGDIQDMTERIAEKQEEIDLVSPLLQECLEAQKKEEKSIEDMEAEKKEIEARIRENNSSFFVGMFRSLTGAAYKDADRRSFLALEIIKASSRLEEAYGQEETFILVMNRRIAELEYLKRKLSHLE